jgi:uncharacterized protein YjbI with pentapeptide repeats
MKTKADLADFSGAKMEMVQMGDASMRGARFVGTQLTMADAANASLDAANFTGATVHRFSLHGAGLDAALLEGARGSPLGTDPHRFAAERYIPAPVNN